MDSQKKKPPDDGGLEGASLLRAGWMLFQAAIATPVYYFCSVTLHGQGLAPGLVAMGFAFLVTLAIVSILDWSRRLRERNQLKRDARERALWGASSSPEQVSRPRISQDISKLI